MSVSPDSRNCQKLSAAIAERLVEAQQQQVVPDPAFAEGRAPMTFRRDANRLTAFSALLLFHGTPSWSRKVNSLSRYFRKRCR